MEAMDESSEKPLLMKWEWFYDRELIEMASNRKMFLSISLQKLMKSVRARGDFQIDNELQIGVDRYPIPMNDVLLVFKERSFFR